MRGCRLGVQALRNLFPSRGCCIGEAKAACEDYIDLFGPSDAVSSILSQLETEDAEQRQA